jgi:UDP-N-acetylglucosamine acyltransferase
MVGGMSRIQMDVPPFMLVEGNPAFVRSLNSVGLKRAQIGPEGRAELKRLFNHFCRSGKNITAAIEALNLDELIPEGRELVEFYATTKRGVIPAKPYRPRSSS